MANPITSVGGVAIPCPSSYVWSLYDQSADGAGRTEDGKMWKNRIGQSVKLELGWQNVSTEDGSTILTAFNPEYISVTYLDLMSGGYRTATFYVGDRSAPMYNATLGLWSNISFNIIEQDAEVR